MEEAKIKLEKALQQLLTPDQYREIRLLVEAAIDEAEDDGWERGMLDGNKTREGMVSDCW